MPEANTGQKLTAAELQEMIALGERARNTPVLCYAPGHDTALDAWEDFSKRWAELMNPRGLDPDSHGVMSSTGEIFHREE